MGLARDRQLGAALTALYFFVESGRRQVREGQDQPIRQAFGWRMRCSRMCRG